MDWTIFLKLITKNGFKKIKVTQGNILMVWKHTKLLMNAFSKTLDHLTSTKIPIIQADNWFEDLKDNVLNGGTYTQGFNTQNPDVESTLQEFKQIGTLENGKALFGLIFGNEKGMTAFARMTLEQLQEFAGQGGYKIDINGIKISIVKNDEDDSKNKNEKKRYLYVFSSRNGLS